MTGRLRHAAHGTFVNREAAGQALVAELAGVVTGPAVVVAVPRGGVAVALPIAERLKAPLTVVYARKLTAPVAPELAFGALDEDGEATLDATTLAMLGLGGDDVERARTRVAGEIRRRMALYGAPPLSTFLPGKTVVLVDDGLATGLTMRAAVAYARRHGALEVVVAVPCASTPAAERFRRDADRFVGLVVDPEFVAVSQYYVDFSPVTDDEVVALLAKGRGGGNPGGPEGLRISFLNSRGRRLAGELLLPPGWGPHAVVVFAHGWGSGKASPRNREAAEALRAAGIAAFLFDFTGHGESEGSGADSTLGQQVDDLQAALAVLRTLDDLDGARVGVVGASSGAAVALRAVAGGAPVRALVLRSGNPEGAERLAPQVTVPTLLIVGERDAATLAANEALAARLGGPHRLEVVPGGDHLFQDPGALRRAVGLTVRWFGEHLGSRSG